MTSKNYNGWTNYETWLVALWMDNERGTYVDRCDAIEDIWEHQTDPDHSPTDRSDAARLLLADWLKDYVERMVPDGLPGFIGDLVNSALSECDYDEIADSWLSETEGYEHD